MFAVHNYFAFAQELQVHIVKWNFKYLGTYLGIYNFKKVIDLFTVVSLFKVVSKLHNSVRRTQVLADSSSIAFITIAANILDIMP